MQYNHNLMNHILSITIIIIIITITIWFSYINLNVLWIDLNKDESVNINCNNCDIGIGVSSLWVTQNSFFRSHNMFLWTLRTMVQKKDWRRSLALDFLTLYRGLFFFLLFSSQYFDYILPLQCLISDNILNYQFQTFKNKLVKMVKVVFLGREIRARHLVSVISHFSAH